MQPCSHSQRTPRIADVGSAWPPRLLPRLDEPRSGVPRSWHDLAIDKPCACPLVEIGLDNHSLPAVHRTLPLHTHPAEPHANAGSGSPRARGASSSLVATTTS